MSRPTLAAYLFGHDLNRIAYPWKESVASALALADRVYFCECDSTDGTYEDVKAMAKINSRLVVLRHPWADNFYGHDQAAIDREGYKIQAHIANFILDEIGTKYDFVLKLDADEVLLETSFDDFGRDLEIMTENGFVLGRPKYTHLLDERRATRFIYSSKATLSRAATGLRFSLGHGGDACALGGAPEYQTKLEIIHYGKWSPGRERESLMKEITFQNLYKALNFPDPLVVKQVQEKGYIDYDEIFHVAKERGEFYAYTGPYPIFAKDWMEKMALRSKEFWNTMSSSQSSVGEIT